MLRMTQAGQGFIAGAVFLAGLELGFSKFGAHRNVVPRELLAPHLRQVALLILVALGGAFDELQKFSQGFALAMLHGVELEANSEAGIAASNNSIEDQTFDPDLPVRDPESDLKLYSGLERRCGFDETSAQAGIREVAPHRRGRAIDPQLDRDKTFHPRIAPPVLTPARSENVRLKRWGRSWRSRNRRLGYRLRRCRRLCARRRALDLAHGLKQHLVAPGGLGITIRLQQFSEMANDVGIGQEFRPVRSRRRDLGFSHFVARLDLGEISICITSHTIE